MKHTKKTLALTLAAVMGLSAAPTLSCSAIERTEFEKTYFSSTYEEPFTLDFIVIMWSENENGELTITGCSPMWSSRVSDYPTANVLGGFVFNGTLKLPSHINGKPVTEISGVNIAKSVGANTVIINENITEISDNAFGKGITVMTTDKELRQSPIYY
ncbi:MAG: hypothetical protein NC485_10195 [Ruminococcus flavefaciens]|nr:hypothetical protein [Ruminococcus flavefaciens]MCM1059267.1 hypothetical protein [Eubacterium sp.]